MVKISVGWKNFSSIGTDVPIIRVISSAYCAWMMEIYPHPEFLSGWTPTIKK